MMTIEEMRKMKTERGYSLEQIAELSGVPLGTVNKVFTGATKTPRHATLTALEKAFTADKGENAGGEHHQVNYIDLFSEGAQADSYVKEAAADYYADRQGSYTLEDYLRISEDKRCELIDGVIYDMASPTRRHQRIVVKLAHYFEAFIEEHGGSCQVYVSIDTQLDKDDRTIVQPDLAVVCHEEELEQRVWGAPEFVVEVLSKSTRNNDMTLKLHKYEGAGVKEYWIIDPEKQRVLVYLFSEDDVDLEIYSLEDKVPVHVFNGELEIDFGMMKRSMPGYWDSI